MGNIFSPMPFIKNYTYEKYNWLDSVNLCLFTTIFFICSHRVSEWVLSTVKVLQGMQVSSPKTPNANGCFCWRRRATAHLIFDKF